MSIHSKQFYDKIHYQIINMINNNHTINDIINLIKRYFFINDFLITPKIHQNLHPKK